MATQKKPDPNKPAAAKKAAPAKKATAAKKAPAKAPTPAKKAPPRAAETPVKGPLKVAEDGRLYIVDQRRKRRYLDELAGDEAPTLEMLVYLSKTVISSPVGGDERTKLIDALRKFLHDRALADPIGKIRCTGK